MRSLRVALKALKYRARSPFVSDPLPEPPLRSLDVFLDTINACNLKCIMCPVEFPRDVKVIPVAVFERIAAEVFPHAKCIMLSCEGEPLLNPDFGTILKIDAPHDAPKGFTTNGVLLTEKACRSIVENGIDTVVVSIDAVEESTFRAIRNTSLRAILSNVETLQRIKAQRGAGKPSISFNYVIMRSNIGEIVRFVNLAERMGVSRIVFIQMNVPSAKALAAETIHDRLDEVEEKLNEARELARAKGITIVQPYYRETRAPKPAGTTCAIPLERIEIIPPGRVLPCPRCRLHLRCAGDMSASSFKDIWASRAMRSFRLASLNTLYNPFCAGCKILRGA